MTTPEYPPPRSRPFDPPDLLAGLRAVPGLTRVALWDGREAWLVTRYAEARLVLTDPRFSSDLARPGLPTHRPVLADRHRTAMVRMDDPRHGELRRLVAREFTPARVDALRPAIMRVVAERLDAMLGTAPPVDLRTAFALPVPTRVIGELLGVPRADHGYLREQTSLSRDPDVCAARAVAAELRLYEYCDSLVAGAEREPAASLVGRLVVDALRPGRIARAELVTMAKILLTAGHETTASMICLGALTMMLHPGWARTLREAPAAVPNAVEELLRYHTIVQDGLPRVATADVVVGGTTVRAGDGVVVSVASANRDAAAFDDPDRPDPARSGARRHLAFGHGPHVCLGLWLARAELGIALAALATRIPGLRLARPLDRLRFSGRAPIYGVRELPVAW